MLADILTLCCLVLLHFPMLLAMGLSLEGVCAGCDCRVTVPGPCAACSGDLVQQYQLVFAGIVDDLCTGASGLNGTYITDASSSGCSRTDNITTTSFQAWHPVCAGGADTCQTSSSIQIQLFFATAVGIPVAPTAQISVGYNGNLNFNTYRFRGNSPLDCTAIVDEPFNVLNQEVNSCAVGGVVGYDNSAATCDVSVV